MLIILLTLYIIPLPYIFIHTTTSTNKKLKLLNRKGGYEYYKLSFLHVQVFRKCKLLDAQN